MKIILKANLPINKDIHTHIGNVTLKNSEIVKFEKTENFNIIEHLNNRTFPIKRSQFEVKFLDEFDDEYKRFNTFIRIKGSICFFVKLKWNEKFKLKWMLKKYKVQDSKNQWKLITFIITTVITVIVGIFNILKKT